jgi:peptide/nickel transport system substrate-binding protein
VASRPSRWRTSLRYGRGATLLFLALSLGSCSRSAEHPSSDAAAQLTVGFGGANPASPDFGVGQFASFFSLEGLTYPGVDGRPSPRLAESWTWEADGLRLRVRLRPGIVFHDGTPLTATVAADILRDLQSRGSNRTFYPSLADIISITSDGPLDVLIELSRRSAFLPDDLSLALEHGSNVGTGPYRIVSKSREELVFERFGPYYQGQPPIEKITIKPFATLRPAWASLLRGDLGMVSEVPPDAVEFVETNDVQVIPFTRGYQYLIAFNSASGALKSPAVRRALNMAVDRDALVQNLFKGYALPATGPIWPKHWAYDTALHPFPYDPRAAMSLLDAAGYRAISASTADSGPARFRFTCLIAGGFNERLALDVQKQLYEIGVDMQFEVVTPVELDARIRQGRFDAVLTDMISGPTLGRPYIFWRSAKESKGINVFGYENADAERQFQNLRSSLNEAAVRSSTQTLQQVLLQDPPALFLVWTQRIRAVNRKFDVVAEPDRDPLLTLVRWTLRKGPAQELARR